MPKFSLFIRSMAKLVRLPFSLAYTRFCTLPHTHTHTLFCLLSLFLSLFRGVTRTRPSSPFWHSGVFEYVLAVTDHSFGLFSKNRYSGTSNAEEMVRTRLFPSLSRSLFLSTVLSFSFSPSHSHLTTTLVDWDGGIVKRISLGYRIRSRSPRRNNSKTPR